MIKYLREKLRNDITPEMMSSALEANIIEDILKISSETYIETGARANAYKATSG